MAHLNNRGECEQFLTHAGGGRGQRVANAAARQIQKCWRKKRGSLNSTQYAKKELHKLTDFQDQNDKAEKENAVKGNSESKNVNDYTSEKQTKKQAGIEDSSGHEKKLVKTVQRGLETAKVFSKQGDDLATTKSSNHNAESITEESGASLESSKFVKEKRKFTNKSAVTVVENNFTSTASDSFSKDKHDLLVEENPTDKCIKFKERSGLTKKSCSEKHKMIAPPDIRKKKSDRSQRVQRGSPASKPPEKENKTSKSTRKENSRLRQSIGNHIFNLSQNLERGVDRQENIRNNYL